MIAGAPGSIDLRLDALARRDGDRVAVRYKERLLTFAGLRSVVQALPNVLGPIEGLRAVALLPDGIATYVLHLGFFAGQGTLVPLSPLTPASQVSAVCARVKPHLLMTSRSILSKYRSLPSLPILLVDEDATGSSGIAGTWHGAPPKRSRPRPETEVRTLLFTSGSTGEPKGVCLGRECLEAAARMNVEILSLQSHRRSLVTVPLFDYYGLIQIFSHLIAGASLVLGETAAFVSRLRRQIEHAEVTDLVGVPYGLRRIFSLEAQGGRSALERLQVVTSSSETLSDHTLDLIFGISPDVSVFDIYGLTEAGRACHRRIRRNAGFGAGSVPSAGVTITGGTSPDDLDELVIRGPNVMLGYLRAVTTEGEVSYEPCDAVHSGDLGYIDPSGSVHLVGRRDHLLNLRGNKIHPSEIESVALQVAGVIDARVRLESGEEPQLVLEIAGRDDIDQDILRTLMSERLPLEFVPRRIVRVGAIARTELGSKLVRRS